jgi:hypothetical protein
MQAKRCGKVVKGALWWVVLALMLPISVVPSPVAADVGVNVNGSRVGDYTAVNGTVAISFWVQSEVAVSSVALCYVDQNAEPACATMRVTEGDVHDGWWEATIRPNVLKGQIEGGTTYRVDVRILHVSLGGKVTDIDVSGFLGSVNVKQEHESSFVLPIPTSWAILPVIGIPIALLVVAVVLMAYRQTH